MTEKPDQKQLEKSLFFGRRNSSFMFAFVCVVISYALSFHHAFPHFRISQGEREDAPNFLYQENLTCDGSPKYVTYDVKDGFGSQINGMMHKYNYARCNNHTYAHTPMNPMNHALDLNLDAEKYVNFGFGSPLAKHVDPECFVQQKFGFSPFGLGKKTKKTCIIDENLRNIFREKFHHGTKVKPLFSRKSGQKICAIHVRRNDVVNSKKFGWRFVQENKIIKVMNAVTKKYGPCEWHVFSDAKDKQELKALSLFDESITLHLREDIFRTYQSFIEADILVTGKSAFSETAGIFSENIIISNFAISKRKLKNWEIIDT